MHDTVLKDSPVLNRRFIRLQAVLHLYAFYVCKRANYDWALDQVHDYLMPDIFTDLPIDERQLVQESQQARALFTSYLPPSSIPTAVIESSSSRILSAATRALANYKHELAQDLCRLEAGFAEAIAKINQACARIWQLLVEWTYIARKQTEKLKYGQQQAMVASLVVAHSPALQRLQDSNVLAKLVQQEVAGWESYLPLVENWYNQFVKPCSTIQGYLAHPTTPHQDQQLLVFLIEDIIFKKQDIQTFFSDIDLGWPIHKRITKKQVHRGLADLTQESQGALSVQTFDLATHVRQEQRFYTALVRKTLQQDVALEALISEKAKNWTIDRIVLLDKTIIKLALCEMLYFDNIPIKVSINEYIDLSKTYSMPKSSQFVNGLLDAVAATLHRGHGKKT